MSEEPSMPGARDAWASASRALAKLREVGPRYALSLLVQRFIPASVLSVRDVEILHLPTRSDPADSAVGRWAAAHDVPLLTQFGHDRETLERRFAEGDRAWIWAEGDRLLAYCWFTSRGYRDDSSGLFFEARPGEVWLYDAMVGRDHRGRGLYPRLLDGAARRLAAEGVSGIWIIMDSQNRNSIRAHEAGGATVRGHASVRTFLGRRRERRSIDARTPG